MISGGPAIAKANAPLNNEPVSKPWLGKKGRNNDQSVPMLTKGVCSSRKRLEGKIKWKCLG